MNLLVKYPSRERPIQFFRILKETMDLATDPHTKFLVSLDYSDPKLKQYTDLEIMKDPRIKVVVGTSKNKIDAVNRDIAQYEEWDVVLILSDDQMPQKNGWDSIILSEMEEKYPDRDGVLYFNDGYTTLNTQCILGRKYYERFGFVYNPEYKSLWADNEFMDIANQLGKQTYFKEVLFKHEHYSNNQSVKADGLMRRTESFYKEDKAVYMRRKAMNFGLNLTMIK